MRLVALLLTLLLLGLAGQSGYALWQRMQAPPAAPPTLTALLPQAGQSGAETPAPARRWPPLFGEPQPPAPPAPPVQAEPQPPAPPMPPVESLGYRLKGVVRNGKADWAIVTHPTGEFLLKVGDALTEDLTVVAIEAEGLWLSRAGDSDDRVLLGFESQSQ